MKLYNPIQVIFVTCALLSVGLLTLAIEDEEAWKQFKILFKKNYVNESEEQHRMKVFFENKRYIERHNTKKSTFIQGINPLSDLSTEEINRTRNGFRATQHSNRSMDGVLETFFMALNATASFDDRAWYDEFLTPAKVDWRTQSRVSKVKDQGNCGSCWAFATTGALESILAASNKTILLSEQNLIDCSGRYGNYGCNGGLMDAALRYVRDHGIMSSNDYQYTGKDGSKCQFQREKSVLRVRGSVTLPFGNEAMLRLALALSGPIPIAIDAGERSFHSYKSGVYNDPACRSSSSALNHAVLLVGYGTDPVAGDYWLVKNSWGNKWGDSGYIKLARNHRNMCGVASFAVLPIP